MQKYRRFNIKYAKQLYRLSFHCSHVICFYSVGECSGRWIVWDRTHREHRGIWCWATYEVNYTGQDLQPHTHAGAQDSRRIITIVIVLTAWQIKAPPPIWTESLSKAAFLSRLSSCVFGFNIWHTRNPTFKGWRGVMTKVSGSWNLQNHLP